MAEGRDTQGKVTGAKPWWQAGSKEQKPSYFTDNAAQKFWKKQSSKIKRSDAYYNKQFGLIRDRNKFYQQNKDMINAPRYTFAEAASLYNKGYAGVFGRSKDNQTVSLLGQPWQQAYALNALRENKGMLEYNIVSTTPTDTEEQVAYKEQAAADQTSGTWKSLLELYSDWNSIGGLEEYKRRYGKGKPPGESSKYRMIFDVNNKAVKADDVQATYQANLSKTLAQVAKHNANVIEQVEDQGVKDDLSNLAATYAALSEDGKISTTDTRGKASKDKIRAMEAALAGAGKAYSSVVEEAVGVPSQTYSKDALSTTIQVLGGPIQGQLFGALAQTDMGQKIANNMINRTQTFVNDESGGLAKAKVDWGWKNLYGGGNLGRNTVTGLARFGIGIVPGSFAIVDEGLLAASEAKKALRGEKEFGEGVDFKMGDAIWADFAQRYYDPFAYRTNEKGEEEFQGFWSGTTNQDDWGDFANKVGEDPVSYMLDVLDVVPIVGWAAKGASVAATVGRVGRGKRFGENVKVELDAAEAGAINARAQYEAARDAVRERVVDEDIRFNDLTNDEKATWREADNAWSDEAVNEYNSRLEEVLASPEEARVAAEQKRILAENGNNIFDPSIPKLPSKRLQEQYPSGRIATRERPTLSSVAGERIGVTRAAARLTDAKQILDSIARRPELIEVLDEAQIQEAAKALKDGRDADLLKAADGVEEARTALTDAEASVLEAKRIYDSIPSVRRFRQVARRALAGEASAKRTMDEWRAAGYNFNGAENTRSLRFSASFEPRTKVLTPTDPVLAQNDLAVVRMPASPIARGIKDAVYWAGRVIVDPAGANVAGRLARAGEKYDSATLGKLAGKVIDMPLIGYRWNYTKAVENSLMDDWGDTATFMRFSADTYKLQANSGLSEAWQQAILGEVFGGSGVLKTNEPFLRRQGIEDELDDISVDNVFRQDENGRVLSTFKAGTEDQAQALIAQRNSLLADTLDDIDARAELFDEEFGTNAGALRRRIADPNYRPDDINLDKAQEIYNRMVIQQERIAQRIVHSGTNPNNIEALRHIYTEVMKDLRILPKHLFGADGKSGSIGKFATRVVRLNTASMPAFTGLIDDTDSAIIDLAQRPRSDGTVFDNFDAAVRRQLEDSWVSFVRTMVNDGDGLFRRGDAPATEIAAPIIVAALDQKGVARGFTRVHLPRLRHNIDNGVIDNGKIIDQQEAFIIPNEFLITKKVGKRRVVRYSVGDEGRKALEVGSLNAMSDLYPNARFYSEKVSESGLMGSRMNERQGKNEHVIATSALREHSLGIAVRSQVAYYRSRIEDSIIRQAEENAVLVPAEDLVGKSPNESGYRILALVRPFSDLERARAFAAARGIGNEFDEALEMGVENLPRVQQIHNAEVGLSTILGPAGELQYVVRGNVKDWAKHSADEDLEANSIMSDYKARAYEDADDIDGQGLVLAVPNIVDRKLGLMVIEGNTYASRLLEGSKLKAGTSLFKRIVLNFRLGFINANVIGGSAMLMARNPMAAAKILARAIGKNAQRSGDMRVANFAGDSKAVDRQLAMELDGNVYKQDAGVAGLVKEPSSIGDLTGGPKEWVKKYIWNGGYTTVAAFERAVRNAVAIDFLTSDPAFRAFMDSPEVKKYIDEGRDYNGTIRTKDDPITPFEAAVDLRLDRASPFFDADLKHRLRYTTNTVSGNYHRFGPFEQLMRNLVMPFYAWQRHSLTYTWRMAVDKPITASALYHIGQEGYNQVAEQGVPDYLRETVPIPQVLKDQLGMIPEDFRIDGSNINPFGATTQLTSALYRVISGDTFGGQSESIFQFANPYLNNLIKDTLGVDPVTGRIDWQRLATKDQNGKGFFGSTAEMVKNIGKSTYVGSVMKTKDIVDNQYEYDAMSNMYPAIENAEDAEKILKNMYTIDASGNPISKGMKGWSLSIPEPRSAGQKDRAVDLFNSLGFKSYLINSQGLNDQSRDEFVSAMALSFYNNKKQADEAVNDVNRVRNWRRRKDYVEWWAEQARSQGINEAVIQIALTKINSERPKNTSVDPNLLLGVMGG